VSTLELVDEMIDHIIKRPRMYAKGLDEAENLVGVLLTVRDSLVGKNPTERESQSLRLYLAEQYPEIPGPVRDVARATQEFGHDEEWWSSEMEKLVTYMRKDT